MKAALQLLALMVASLSASQPKAEVWTLGSLENFAPYNYFEDGIYTGIDVAILEQASQNLGVTLEHFPTSWRRALLDFDSGKLDGLFQLTPTEERFKKWHMVGPLRTTQTVFMTLKESDIVDVTSLEDLQGLVVGIVSGFTYGHAFDDDTAIIREPSVEDFANVRKLLLGRSDVIVGGRETLIFVAQELNAQNKVRILPTPLVSRARYIAFQKNPEGYDKAQRLQAELDRMAEDGRITATIQSFLKE